MNTFLTRAELSRKIGVPESQLVRLQAARKLIADACCMAGRLQLFSEVRIPEISQVVAAHLHPRTPGQLTLT